MNKSERLYSLKELVQVLKRECNVRRNERTIYAWFYKGRILKPGSGDQRRVKLEARVVGGRIETSVEAYERFEAKLNEAREEERV